MYNKNVGTLYGRINRAYHWLTEARWPIMVRAGCPLVNLTAVTITCALPVFCFLIFPQFLGRFFSNQLHFPLVNTLYQV